MSSRLLAGRYELIEKIGEGGMAIVYKAKCRLLNRYVAIYFCCQGRKIKKIGIRGSKFINCLFPTFIKPVRMIKVFLWIRKGELLF